EARRRESADLITVPTAVMVQVLGGLIIVDRLGGAFGATAVAGRSENQIARLSDLHSRAESFFERQGDSCSAHVGPDDPSIRSNEHRFGADAPGGGRGQGPEAVSQGKIGTLAEIALNPGELVVSDIFLRGCQRAVEVQTNE